MNDINKSEKKEKIELEGNTLAKFIENLCEWCEEKKALDEHMPVCKECSEEFVRCISCDELVHWEDAYYIKIYVAPTYFCEPCFAERQFSVQK